MWSVSDDALVAGLAAGDSDAASAFVRRFQRRVFGLARTIVPDDRAAEDVAQEAFLRAWRHAAAYDPRRGSVVGWLLTITRNLAIDAVRVRRPVELRPAVLMGFDRESTEREPHDMAQLGDDTARLRAALAATSRGAVVERSCLPVCSATPRAKWARSRTFRSVPRRPGSAPRSSVCGSRSSRKSVLNECVLVCAAA